jgi:alpha-tubulin suppressor-like RCC1 family protein
MPNRSMRRTAALVSAVLAGSLVLAQSPAFAAATASHVKAAAAPATVRVGGTVTVTGSVTPKGATSVSLQRLVGRKWASVAHAKTTRTGSYVLSLHAPRAVGALTLRVARPATTTAKAAVSATLHVRVVKTSFAVTATHAAGPLTSAQPLVITGKVSPKGKGSVSLDRLVGSRWVSLVKAPLTARSTYSFSRKLPTGSYKLRVSKPFTATVAGGVSKSFSQVITAPVVPPPPPPTLPAVVLPVVTTASLSGIVVGAPYTATLQATSGTAPYTWSVASGSLPTGLTLLPSGVLFGTPTTVAAFSFTVRATDALGHSGTGSITAAVHGVAVRSWGYDLAGTYGDGTTTSTLAIATALLPGATKTIAGSDNFALALQADGTVYAWGVNTDGQLGLGDTTDRPTPTQIPGLTHVTAIAAGEDASYAVTASGTLYTWGNNASGQLGNGSHGSTLVKSPTAIAFNNVVSVAAGNQFALALAANGGVFGFGSGSFGVIGDGTNTPEVDTPTQAHLSTGAHTFVAAVSASSTASYALLSDGTVQAWGLQEHGQLGNGPPTGLTQPTPAAVAGLTGVTAISCTGFEFCLALHGDHTVSAWGNSIYGGLGNGQSSTDSDTAALVPGLTDITAIATAQHTGYALHADGTVSSWGWDGSNELGDGDATFTNTSSPARISGLTNVVAVGAGSRNGYAIQAR